MNQEQIVQAVMSEVQRRLVGQGAGHGFDHVERVLRVSRQIQAETGGDLFVIELAALLHDVGDAKFHEGVELSGKFAREILSTLGVSDEIIEHVVHIVENISFRKRDSAAPLSIEGSVVQDADRLDALGAVGIVRTIEYGASFDQPFFDPSQPDAKSGVRHFFDKLFKLRALMNTQAGNRLAEEREEFMRVFLRQFLSECGAERLLPEFSKGKSCSSP